MSHDDSTLHCVTLGDTFQDLSTTVQRCQTLLINVVLTQNGGETEKLAKYSQFPQTAF